MTKQLIFPAFALFCVVQWIVCDRIFGRVKRHHEDIWEQLGRRDSFVIGWWGEGRKLHKFIWGSVAKRRDDRRTYALALISRTAEVLAVLMLVVGVIGTLSELK